jgi:hypothetical protein
VAACVDRPAAGYPAYGGTPGFEPIELKAEGAADLRIIAELVAVLE